VIVVGPIGMKGSVDVGPIPPDCKRDAPSLKRDPANTGGIPLNRIPSRSWFIPSRIPSRYRNLPSRFRFTQNMG
jgi:hypothetical protein